MHKIRESQTPGVIDIVLYNKNICNYIIYDIYIKSHKTHCHAPEWTPPFRHPGTSQERRKDTKDRGR